MFSPFGACGTGSSKQETKRFEDTRITSTQTIRSGFYRIWLLPPFYNIEFSVI